MINTKLPSPHGDELFQLTMYNIYNICLLPSPRGDELFLASVMLTLRDTGYRPLAGMNCFLVWKHWREFCGEKLPSPRGDELFLGSQVYGTATLRGYRPLAGMNCFYTGRKTHVVGNGYRPLAGMNCFRKY